MAQHARLTLDSDSGTPRIQLSRCDPKDCGTYTIPATPVWTTETIDLSKLQDSRDGSATLTIRMLAMLQPISVPETCVRVTITILQGATSKGSGTWDLKLSNGDNVYKFYTVPGSGITAWDDLKVEIKILRTDTAGGPGEGQVGIIFNWFELEPYNGRPSRLRAGPCRAGGPCTPQRAAGRARWRVRLWL